MNDEPYRWLEAIANRREYVREQLKFGSPVFAVSLESGILLFGVGDGSTKVFEIHDRHAMAGLGHPADMERVRQIAIDAAHVEAFTRDAQDVSLRRLVGFGLGPQFKQNFEQLSTAPILGEFIFAELAPDRNQDVLARLNFDGTFSIRSQGIAVAAASAEAEAQAFAWLGQHLAPNADIATACRLLLECWDRLMREISFTESPGLKASPQSLLGGKHMEAALLRRGPGPRARYAAIESSVLT